MVIETRVRVLSSSNGVSYVEATEHNGCGACASKESCGISGLGRLFSNRRQPVALHCASARTGEELIVGVDESDLLTAGLWAYLLPVVLAIAGAGLAAVAGLSDPLTVLATGLGLALGLLLARFFARAPRLHVRQSEHFITTGETP
jgi:sigma-E factor negative regulatory protein RseC